MLRLACGIAIIAFIFAHSPERPKEPISADAARWIEVKRTELTEAALRSSAAQDLVRQSFASGDSTSAKSAR